MNRETLEDLSLWFSRYCRGYYTGDGEDDRNIALKEEHTSRVRDNISCIAAAAGLAERDLLLAESVALFHDVGRFSQYRRYRTFRDADSVNHAVLGAEVLKSEGLLDKLPRDEQDMIIRAVRLHNVFRLPGHLDDETALHARLIRDADKLDIWRVFVDYFSRPEAERASAAGLGFPDVPGCSPEVAAFLERGELVDLTRVRSLNDFKLLQLSWVFDLNFAESFRMMRERNLIDRIVVTIPDTPEVGRGLAAVRKIAERQ